jgi:hypothetical protein
MQKDIQHSQILLDEVFPLVSTSLRGLVQPVIKLYDK